MAPQLIVQLCCDLISMFNYNVQGTKMSGHTIMQVLEKS